MGFRVALVRLLVATLLCVVGAARPMAAHADPSGARRDRAPMEVAAAPLHAELTRLGRRFVEDPASDSPALVQTTKDATCVGRAIVLAIATPTSRRLRDQSSLVRARGPPR